MRKKHRGRFITLEGGEGAGKSSFIAFAARALSEKGHEVVTTLEPGGTPLGKEIRELLLHQKLEKISKHAELFLFLADRSQHVREVILPALRQGKIILCDRYNDSTIAYQGVARSLDLPFIRSLCAFATEALTPDLTLYLDLDPEIGLARTQSKRGYDRLEQETLHFHTQVRAAFLQMAGEEPERFHRIDASLPEEEVRGCGLKEIEALLCAH